MAFSRAPPPTRGQHNLLGFMQMPSKRRLRRLSLEQLMVESGQLEPEQTLNHRAWGPLSVPPCSAPAGRTCWRPRSAGPMGHFPIKKNSETGA